MPERCRYVHILGRDAHMQPPPSLPFSPPPPPSIKCTHLPAALIIPRRAGEGVPAGKCPKPCRLFWHRSMPAMRVGRLRHPHMHGITIFNIFDGMYGGHMAPDQHCGCCPCRRYVAWWHAGFHASPRWFPCTSNLLVSMCCCLGRSVSLRGCTA